jgi:hypothetical protein
MHQDIRHARDGGGNCTRMWYSSGVGLRMAQGAAAARHDGFADSRHTARENSTGYFRRKTEKEFMIWNDDTDSLLVKFWNEGGSLKYVADEMQKLGYTVSRSAIAGRKHRLEGALLRKVTATPTTKMIERKQPINSNRRETVTTLQPRASTKPVSTIELDDITNELGVEYLTNTERGCKALLDKRGGQWALPMCCGRPRSNDYNGALSPYCSTHYRLFHNTSTYRSA